MKAFGISNRDPGQHERAMISKWADTYCFDTDIIIEACNRTIKAIHQPSFEYADTILSKWKNANVTTMEDIKKMMRHTLQVIAARQSTRTPQSLATAVLITSSSVTSVLMTGIILYWVTTVK